MSLLGNSLEQIKFHETIELEATSSKDLALSQISKISNKTIPSKVGRAKLFLIKSILEQNTHIKNQDLMMLYNEIVSVRVKAINKKSVRELMKQLQA